MIAVSVIIPIYNDDEFLQECLESVMAQTLSNIEIICINDGSDDKTEAILNRYAGEYKKIRVVNQTNQGVSCARNKGIQLAKGEYIAFMDGDDFYSSNDVLEYLYKTAKSKKVKVCGGSIVKYRYGERIELASDTIAGKMFRFGRDRYYSFHEYGMVMGFSRFIYDREMLLKEGIYFPHTSVFEDPLFLAEALTKSETFYAVKKNIYCYRVATHTREYSKKVVCEILENFWKIMVIAKKTENISLQINCISILTHQYLDKIFPFYQMGDVDVKSLVEKIDDSVLEKVRVGHTEGVQYLGVRGLKSFREEVENEYAKFYNVVMQNPIIIIYGAGTVGKKICDFLFLQLGISPTGIAVTKKERLQKSLNGIEITEIGQWADYWDNALFIIAAYDNKDMLAELGRIGAKKVYVVQDSKLCTYISMCEACRGERYSENQCNNGYI